MYISSTWKMLVLRIGRAYSATQAGNQAQPADKFKLPSPWNAKNFKRWKKLLLSDFTLLSLTLTHTYTHTLSLSLGIFLTRDQFPLKSCQTVWLKYFVETLWNEIAASFLGLFHTTLQICRISSFRSQLALLFVFHKKPMWPWQHS